ncbi:AAA family ATPase [Nocardioides cynanchi]|uniref:AAA family ATPase n=1 Tax=Nocardioides cynanchi TaxID=2558918 RepID=UPI001247F409|nr:AAA family ATPase [Nocardioides cynanchi]
MQVWWVYGASGVGKSVTSWRLFQGLGDDGAACAYVDIDQLGMCYPALDDDPWRDRLKGRVLAGIAGSYAAAGCERLVVSGVLDPDLIGWYADRMAPYDLVMCRLTVDDAELTRRLEARGVDAEWVADALEEAHDLAAAGLLDRVVDTGSAAVPEVAAAVRSALSEAAPADGTGEPDDPPTLPDQVTRALWVTGPTAVGKSTVGFGIFLALRDETTAAYLDLEQLGFSRGIDADVRIANAATAWRCFRAGGAQRLVVTGPLRSAAERVQLERMLAPTPLRVVGLTTSEASYGERVAARGRGEAPELAGDTLVGASEEQLAAVARRGWAEQRDTGTAPWDASYDTTGRSAAEVGAEVLGDW